MRRSDHPLFTTLTTELARSDPSPLVLLNFPQNLYDITPYNDIFISDNSIINGYTE